jgi:hypothetical protein
MKKVATTPEEYLAQVLASSREDMREIDKAISNIFGEKERVVWKGKLWGGTQQTIIGYGDFRYSRSDKEQVEWFMVGLAAQKNYISVYINAAEDGRYVVKKYADRLGKVKVGSSSVSFKKLDDVNLKELLRLVTIAHSQLKK